MKSQEEKENARNTMRETFSRYPRVAPVNRVLLRLGIVFVIFSVLFNTYCLTTWDINAFVYVAPIALLVAFPLGIVGFMAGLIARWGGFAGRHGEIVGLSVLGTTFLYAVATLIFGS